MLETRQDAGFSQLYRISAEGSVRVDAGGYGHLLVQDIMKRDSVHAPSEIQFALARMLAQVTRVPAAVSGGAAVSFATQSFR
jgi:hypothetical protein